MTPEELDRAVRERRDADTRYNDALTALDRAIVSARDAAANGEDRLGPLTTALIVFLQQITAFVDTKDREASAVAGARFSMIEDQVRSLSELRTQVGLLTRATKAIERSVTSSPAVPGSIAPQAAAGAPEPSRRVDDYKYVGFEDEFRGTDESIAQRLRDYVPLFAGRSGVLDIGCGRGEFLALLKAAGIPAQGIDLNAEMAAVARARGLDAIRAEAVEHLASLPDESLGGVIATQVVEHLEPGALMRLLDLAARKLRPEAPLVLETINPACWLAFFSSYIRDITHVRPLHPDTLQFLLRANGFERVEVRYSAPVPQQMKMRSVDLPAEVLASTEPGDVAIATVAHAVNANAVILNNLMFTHLDYAAIGYRS